MHFKGIGKMNKSIIVKLAAAAAVVALAGCTDLKPLQSQVDTLKSSVAALQSDLAANKAADGATAAAAAKAGSDAAAAAAAASSAQSSANQALAAAQAAYIKARPFYERIEPVAESFGDLDPRIDARENDVEEGVEWTGWHRIEKALWVDKSLAGMTPMADQMLADTRELVARIGSVTLRADQVTNGGDETDLVVAFNEQVLLGRVSAGELKAAGKQQLEPNLVERHLGSELDDEALRLLHRRHVERDDKAVLGGDGAHGKWPVLRRP